MNGLPAAATGANGEVRHSYGDGASYASSSHALEWNGATLRIKGDIGDSVVFNNYSTTQEMNSAIGTAVAGIEIGGKNLLGNTSNPTVPTINNSAAAATFRSIGRYNSPASEFSLEACDSSTNSMVITSSVTGNRGVCWYTKPGEIVAGKTYTFSCKVKTSVAAVVHTHTAWRDGTATAGYVGWTSNGSVSLAANKWTDYSYTFTPDARAQLDWEFLVGLCFTGQTSGVTCHIAHAKLEKGNKATDWTPAPEDVDASIEEAIPRLTYSGVMVTANGTYAKAATCKGFTLETGAVVSLYMNNSEVNAAALTLNINGTGAKDIYVGGEKVSAANRLSWLWGCTITFVYNGTGYVVADYPPTYSGSTCSAAEGTAAKDTIIDHAVLLKGTAVTVPMTASNTAAAPTLHLRNAAGTTLAAAVYFGSSNTAPTKANGFAWPAGAAVSFTFDGQYWRFGNQTFIDGGNILTGSVAADRIKANVVSAINLTTNKIDAKNINAAQITVGSLSDGGSYSTTSQMDSAISSSITNIRSWYATCSTAADAAAKVATISPTTTAFTTSVLKAGTLVNVKFTVTNTAAVADLTLNVNGTGAKPIKTLRYGAINNIAGVGYLAANVTYQFTYDGTNWVVQENYNADTYNRTRHQNAITAAAAITSGRIICGTASGYRNIGASVAFDISYPLLYAGSAIAAAGTGDNNYLSINGINASNNAAITGGAAKKTLYLKGTLSGSTLMTASSGFLTATVPTSKDNFVYLPLGVMYSATNIYFVSPSKMYAYKGGKFQEVGLGFAAAHITEINDNGIKVHADNNATTNYVQIDSTGMDIVKGGASVAFYGDTARIGKNQKQRVEVSASAVDLYNSSNELQIKIGATRDNGLYLHQGGLMLKSYSKEGTLYYGGWQPLKATDTQSDTAFGVSSTGWGGGSELWAGGHQTENIANDAEFAASHTGVVRCNAIYMRPGRLKKMHDKKYGTVAYTGDTFSLGTYIAAGILTSATGTIEFSIPTGMRIEPSATINSISFNILVRAGNHNGTGMYIVKASSGGSDAASFNSSSAFTFYNGTNQSKSLAQSKITKSIQGNTNLLISMASGTDYFFSGNATNSGYLNNQPCVVRLTGITVSLAYAAGT